VLVSVQPIFIFLYGYHKPGVEVCESIARAFKIPPECVFRQAGFTRGSFEHIKHTAPCGAGLTGRGG
jgi:hypothetical protein